MLRTVRDLKRFLEEVPDEALVCPVKEHTIHGTYVHYGIIFDNADKEWIFYASD